MKSERRHELHHNALADWLSTTLEQLRPYQTTLLGVVLLVLLGFLAASWWSRHAKEQRTQAWEQTLGAMRTENIAVFDDVIEHQAGTPVAEMAGVLEGDILAFEGAQKRFVDRAASQTAIDKAILCYQQVIGTGKSPMLQERAAFGLARALETQGKLDEALKKYQEVVEKWPQGTFAAAATQRSEDLQKPAIKKFYDDFAAFTPKPVSPDEGKLPSREGLSKPDSLRAEPGAEPKIFNEDSPFKGLGTTDEKPSDTKPYDIQTTAGKPTDFKPAEKKTEKKPEKKTDTGKPAAPQPTPPAKTSK